MRTVEPFDELRPGLRRLREHDPDVLERVHLDDVWLQLGVDDLGHGVVAPLADHVRHVRLRLAGGDADRDEVAALDPLAGLRVLRDHEPDLHVVARLADDEILEAGVEDLLHGELLGMPLDVRHGDGLRLAQLVLDLLVDEPAADERRPRSSSSASSHGQTERRRGGSSYS